MAKVVREPLATVYAFLGRFKFVIFFAVAAAIVLLVLGVEWHMLVSFPVLFLASVFSMYYRRFMHVPPAFELVSLSTVIVGMAYGPVIGAVFGAVAGLAAEIVSGGIDAFVVSYVPARAVMGLLAGFFPFANVIVLGVVLVAVYNMLAQSLYLLQGDPEAKIKTAVFVFFNLGINFVIFSLLGDFTLSLLR